MLYVEIVCYSHEYFWGTKNGVEADGNCGALHRKPVSLTTRISFRPTSFRHKIYKTLVLPKFMCSSVNFVGLGRNLTYFYSFCVWF